MLMGRISLGSEVITLMVYQYKYILLEFNRLPNFKAVGGNRRGHWRAEYTARTQERNAWIEEMVIMGYKSRDTAMMESPIDARVQLVFPTSKRGPRPDKDNAISAMKDLFDCLEPWRTTNRNRSTRGFAGLFVDDKDIVSLHLEYLTGSAPKTLIHLQTLPEG